MIVWDESLPTSTIGSYNLPAELDAIAVSSIIEGASAEARSPTKRRDAYAPPVPQTEYNFLWLEKKGGRTAARTLCYTVAFDCGVAHVPVRETKTREATRIFLACRAMLKVDNVEASPGADSLWNIVLQY